MNPEAPIVFARVFQASLYFPLTVDYVVLITKLIKSAVFTHLVATHLMITPLDD